MPNVSRTLWVTIVLMWIVVLQPLNVAAQSSSPFADEATVERESRLDPGYGLDTYAEIEEFGWNVLEHLDAVWTNWMAAAGYPYEPSVSIAFLLPDQSIWTECGGDNGSWAYGDEQNAFYCPADDTIYLPLDFLWNHIWTYDPGPVQGDFALATTIAHEFGHHIMWEIVLQADAMGYNVDLPGTVKYEELFADCLAGAWSWAVYLDSYLDAGDLDEAVESMYASGDYAYDDPDHHGTPAERANAWSVGMYGTSAAGYYNQSGAPANCITGYWRY